MPKTSDLKPCPDIRNHGISLNIIITPNYLSDRWRECKRKGTEPTVNILDIQRLIELNRPLHTRATDPKGESDE